MDLIDISGEVEFLLEGNEKMRFIKREINNPFIPTEEQLQKKILRIELSYSFRPNQDSSISQIRNAFGTGRGRIIRKIPKNLRIEEFNNFLIFKYGYINIAPSMFGLTEKVGVTGYWDNSNIVICCLKEYGKLFNNIQELFEKNKAMFDIRMDSWGPNLRILSL